MQDTKNRVFWGCQLYNTGSWQIEVSRFDDGVCLSGGPADYELGHWRKELLPGESFRTPEAVLTVTRGNTALEADIASVEALLNHRPRKCLDWKTPFEVFWEKSVALD